MFGDGSGVRQSDRQPRRPQENYTGGAVDIEIPIHSIRYTIINATILHNKEPF